MMKRIINLVFTVLIVMTTMGETKKKTSVATLDFAYPEKVEQSAMRDLEAALKQGNGPATVNAIVRVGLAKSVVSSDSVSSVFKKVETMRQNSEDVAVRSLLALFEAKIYVLLYKDDYRNIVNRDVVAGMAGDNYKLWGEQQYRDKVALLLSEAMMNRGELLLIPLTDYADVLEFERQALTFYPTLYDFVANEALACYSAFGGDIQFSRKLALSPLDTSLYPAKTKSSFCYEKLYTYFMLAKGREMSAPGILARSNQLQYILSNLFQDEARYDVPAWAEKENGKPSFDFEANLKAYNECASSVYAVEFLLNCESVKLNATEKTELYNLLGEYIADNSNYFNINAVKNLREEIEAKRVNVRVPQQAAVGVPMMVTIESRNVNEIRLKVYDVTGKANIRKSEYYKVASNQVPIQEMDVQIDEQIPFESCKEVEITLPKYGSYVVAPEFEGQEKEREYPIVACSNLSTGVYSGVGGAKAVAVDAVTGAPRSGVTMYYTPWSRETTNRVLPGATDAAGLLNVEIGKPGTLQPRDGGDIYGLVSNYYNVTERKENKTPYCEVFTSLNLYHLGDKVDFVVVAYDADKNRKNIAADRRLRVTLRDANYMVVDTIGVITDKWGRAEGVFTLPEDGLTGNFTINVGEGGRNIGYRSIMVSDYKLPTFEVKVSGVERPTTLGEGAVIKGNAQTFSSFPVEDGQVKVQMRVRTGFWFWATESAVFYETETVTDSKGDFVVNIPGDVIATSPAPEGYFVVAIAVTSADGETHETTSGFNMGKPMSLIVDIPEIYQIDRNGTARVVATDYNGKEVDIQLSYEVKMVDEPLYGGETTEKLVKQGTCASGNVNALFDKLKSGKYRLTFAPVDASLAETVYAEVIVYSAGDKHCPVNELLWLPENSVVANADGTAEILLGTAVKNAHILMVVADNYGRLEETRWIKTSNGLEKVKVRMPSDGEGVKVYFAIVSHLKSKHADVTVMPASTKQAITIETETFRDKVTPGDAETIKFRVKSVAGADVESAIILDMSNKAIDVLSANPMNFTTRHFWSRTINMDGLGFDWNYMHIYGKVKLLNDLRISAPKWQFYGVNLLSPYMTIGKSRLMNKLAEGAVFENDMDFAAPVYASNQGSAVMMDGAVTESAIEEAAPQEAEPKPAEEDDTYRPSEMPLAFFRPMLQTDDEGNLEVTYIVPDANTTWVLRSVAYNRALQTANNKVEIVASKPVMVSTNATRFLRVGDKVRLQASVMNATDSVIVANTLCEVLDYTTGKVLASSVCTDSIDAVGRKVVNIDFEATTDVKGVIYRVKSSAGTFTDGEQVLIPVLPSEQDVVESKIFYLVPGENNFTMPVEAVKKGRAYLRFTENPTWEVVSAFPGLRQGEINSSMSAAASIFSAAVADGLMKEYPEIARTLRRWRDNPTDSALVSELEKNEELKTILLSSTPWVSEALSQTERMQRLVLLLDGKNTRKVIDKGIRELAKHVTADGGWSWTTQYPEVSEWCTGHILDMMGDLNRLGWLPNDEKLNTMIENAILYLDREAAKDYKKYPKADYTLYCYTRLKFPEVKQSTASAKVTNVMVQRIIAGWKQHSVVMKAVDAIILNANGYNATARQILESLRQYATVSPAKGMWWQQLEHTWFNSLDKVGCTSIVLDAFAMTDPGNAAIDKIRQWLILEKTNTDWGNAIITSQVVSSILTSGKKWTINSAGTAVRVGNALLTPTKEEYAIGAFTEQITPLVKENTTITIDRQGNYPSFGAVMIMQRLAMDEVKAVSCEELSVKKYLSVYNGSEWVPSSTFKVGDKVKVTITIEANTDMDYVVLQDQRAAALEPVEQLPMPLWSEGLCFYRENRDSQTNIFINRMPRGTYVLSYDLFVSQAGIFSSGVVQAQSQYNPAIAAHSAGMEVTIEK